MLDTNIRLTLRKGFMDDWWIIERADHDGRVWIEETGPHSSAVRMSSRFSDADVEGTGGEMLALASAIESKGGESFKRCAVRCEGNLAFFCSPRNSQVEGVTSYEHALDLAKQIRAALEREGES